MFRNLVSALIGIAIGLPLSLYAQYTRPYTGAVEISRNIEKPVYEALSAAETHPNRIDTMVDPAFEVDDTAEQIAEEEHQAELELLACLVYAEAGIEDLHGKRLVVDVVLNRVDSDRFPNTITDVIYEKNQFSTVTDGALERAYREVTQECYDAVALELEERTDSNILFFTAGGYNSYCTPMYQYKNHFFGK